MDWSDERIVITGGAGFVGSHLAEELHRADADVEVIDSLHAGRADLVPDGVTLHETDIRSSELSEIVKSANPTILYHLAALHYIPYCNDHPEETFETNVLGTRRVLEAARAEGQLGCVVSASTAGVYEPAPEPHSEADSRDPIDIYGRTKLIGEDLCELFQSDTGVPTVSARLFNIYGPNETNEHLIPAILTQVRDGARTIDLGNLEPARDFIHVEDVRDALMRLASDHESGYGVYNVGTGTEHTVREVVEAVETALGEEITIQQDPERVRKSDRPHLCADISRIEAETGWSPTTSLTEGLRSLLATDRITA